MRWALGLLGLASVYLVIAFILPAVSASTQGAPAAVKCIHSQRQLIAKGESPGRSPWTITGTIGKNGNCRSWLFGMEFVPSGTIAGSFSWHWGVLAGGHLSDRFTIGAEDEVSGSERVFGGVVGGRVRRVVVRTSEGKPMTIRPKLPALSLRRRFVWLRNMRYLIRFYPAGRQAKIVTLLDGRGEVIEKLRPVDGGFEGPGV